MTAVYVPEGNPDAGAVWHYGDPLGEQRAALTHAVLIDRSTRAVLALSGPERLSWLHTVSSQHVADLRHGQTRENLSLDGQGRVEDHWVQTDLDGITYLDTESWRGQPLKDFLTKMVFWSKVEVAVADLKVFTLLGPDTAGLAETGHRGTARARQRCGAARRRPHSARAVAADRGDLRPPRPVR